MARGQQLLEEHPYLVEAGLVKHPAAPLLQDRFVQLRPHGSQRSTAGSGRPAAAPPPLPQLLLFPLSKCNDETANSATAASRSSTRTCRKPLNGGERAVVVAAATTAAAARQDWQVGALLPMLARTELTTERSCRFAVRARGAITRAG